MGSAGGRRDDDSTATPYLSISWYPWPSGTARTGVRSMTVIVTPSGQSRVTCAVWTWRICSIRWAIAAPFTLISGTPGGMAAADRTSALVTRCVPVTVTERTTKNRESSRAQLTPPTMATAARAKKAARQGWCPPGREPRAVARDSRGGGRCPRPPRRGPRRPGRGPR